MSHEEKAQREDESYPWADDSVRGLREMFEHRHPAVVGILRWLEPNPNLSPPQAAIAQIYAGLTMTILQRIDVDDPELPAGLRKLVEAKDCHVRASLAEDFHGPGGFK